LPAVEEEEKGEVEKGKQEADANGSVQILTPKGEQEPSAKRK